MARRRRKRRTRQERDRLVLIRALVIVAACGAFAFYLIAAELFQIQIVDNARLEGQALANQLVVDQISAQRGAILDTNSQILAMSADTNYVFLSPLELAEHEDRLDYIVRNLSAILGVERDYIMENALKYPSQYQVIKRNVSDDDVERIREFNRANGFRGIYTRRTPMRHYPNNYLASHVLGFVGNDNSGLDGIERLFDRYLTGIHGREVRIRNALGAGLHFTEFEDFFDAQHGNNIFLTIDAQVQNYLEMGLRQAIADYDVQNGGVGIVMNARTGAILAIASYPTFDPNNFGAISEREMERISQIDCQDERLAAFDEVLNRQWRNRPLADTYEPGSVFKTMTMAMALEENVATLDCMFFCGGSTYILGRVDEYERPLPLLCANRNGHGWLTLDEAMQRSCNVAFVELGLMVGAHDFYSYIDAFGLFDRTGLDNSVEGSSIWWSERVFFDRRNHSQLASASFGQTFKVTPIQMITSFAATVNGGYLMQPHIVRQITDGEGNIVKAVEPTVVRQVISADTSAAVRYSLENVVMHGTGRNAQVRGFRIGGKTGTSENIEQLANMEEDPLFKEYIVSFAGFAPADDPEVVVLFLLDTPGHNTGLFISGGTMAAPAVGRLLNDILYLYLGIQPRFTEEDLKHINVRVPRLTPLSISEAEEMLTSQGLGFTVVGGGDEVTGQAPAANSIVSPGTTVILYTGQPISREPVEVPSLTRLSFDNAIRMLENRGLFIRTTGLLRTDPRAEVSVQSVNAGEYAPFGSVIEVTLIDRNASEFGGGG
jgi:stage V sporulation protein D (sporulation-specific penicillin-binding protein)